MVKILFTYVSPRGNFDTSSYSGSISHTLNLIKAFQKIGCQVIEVMPSGNKAIKKIRNNSTLLKKCVHPTIWTGLSNIYEIAHNSFFKHSLLKVCKETIPDFIYERFANFQCITARVARKICIPYIVEMHSPMEERIIFEKPLFQTIEYRIRKSVLRQADAIVVVSNALKEYYVGKDTDPNKIYVIPNAVDTELFNPLGEGDNIRNKLDIKDKIVIGVVGSMHIYHGLEFLVKSAVETIKDFPRVRFLMVGPLRKKIEEFAQKQGVADYFCFTGKVQYQEIPKYISAMNICTMPGSNWYGSPIKIFEYGAMGKPIIAPRLGPITDVLRDGQTALLFEPDNLSDFVGKMVELIENEPLRHKLGKGWLQEVRQNHTWVNRVKQIVRIYGEITKDHEDNSSEDFGSHLLEHSQ